QEAVLARAVEIVPRDRAPEVDGHGPGACSFARIVEGGNGSAGIADKAVKLAVLVTIVSRDYAAGIDPERMGAAGVSNHVELGDFSAGIPYEARKRAGDGVFVVSHSDVGVADGVGDGALGIRGHDVGERSLCTAHESEGPPVRIVIPAHRRALA